MDPTFYPALFSFLDHVTLACIVAGVLILFAKMHPVAFEDLLNRITKLGLTGMELTPGSREVKTMKGQLDVIERLLRLNASPAQLAASTAPLQASLDALSTIVAKMSVTETPDTARIESRDL